MTVNTFSTNRVKFYIQSNLMFNSLSCHFISFPFQTVTYTSDQLHWSKNTHSLIKIQSLSPCKIAQFQWFITHLSSQISYVFSYDATGSSALPCSNQSVKTTKIIIIHSKYFPVSDWLKPHA